MVFRRRMRRFPRRGRRKLHYETRTFLQCRAKVELYQSMTCTTPLVDAITLLAPNMFDSPSELQPLVSPSSRGVSLKGMKFQSSWFIDPAENLFNQNCDPSPRSLAFMLTIWEALCILPLQHGFLQFGASPSPAYLPFLTNPAFQGSDFADRVLWKRIVHIPYWGLDVGNGVFPQLVSTQQLNAENDQIIVKSRAFLDDKHGLFLVRNFVHDQFIDLDPLCHIALTNDLWGKMFYRAVV